MKFRLFTCLVLLSFAVVPVSLFAQAAQPSQSSQGTCCPQPSPNPCCPAGTATGGGLVAEFSPYSGYVWPHSFTGIGDFKGSQVFGVRGGFYVTSGFEIGGNYYYNPHFQPRRANSAASLAGNLGFPQGAVRANVWEVEFTQNFGSRSLFGSSVRPYVVGGAGGLTTHISKNADTFVLNVRAVNNSHTVFVPNDVLESGDTFFTISYGGGIKTQRLWGPMGFFGDFRGRTAPNFIGGHGNTWPELTAGFNFAWGEK